MTGDKAGKKVVAVVSGGNIDVTLLARIIERGLVKDGRLVRLRVHLPDYPGALHRLTGILAQHRANIVETSYDRAYHNVNLGDTAIDITVEAGTTMARYTCPLRFLKPPFSIVATELSDCSSK